MVLHSIDGGALLKMNERTNVIEVQQGRICVNYYQIEKYSTQERALYECIDLINAFVNSEQFYQFSNSSDIPMYDVKTLNERDFAKQICDTHSNKVKITINEVEDVVVIYLKKSNE